MQKIQIVILVFACQFSSITFFGIKLGEMFIFLLLPAIIDFNSSKNTIVRIWLWTFAILMGISVFVNLRTNFYIPSFGGNALKSPYWITISRFLEVALCVAAYKMPKIMRQSTIELRNLYINRFITYNAIFVVFILLLYVFQLIGGPETVAQEKTYRLKGFYVEGGPFGVYISALISFALISGNRRIWVYLVYGVALFLSASKAGFLLIITLFIIYAILNARNVKSFLIIIFGVISIFIFFIIFLGNQLNGYYHDYVNIDYVLMSRYDDLNLIAGRISGVFIGINMIKNNPLIGVGMGNYSLVRNNPDYLGIFPSIDIWDLTGLGGLFTILVENGMLGIVMVGYAYYRTTKIISSRSGRFAAVIPVMTFLFGTAYYFIFPWVILGMAAWIKPDIYKKIRLKY